MTTSTLTLEEGEILALLGENGAGKTTLMNILYGLYQPDEGEIFVRGKQITVHSPTDAIAAGIGMVHQHFMLIPVFTVTENVMLGDESLKAGTSWTAPRSQPASARFRTSTTWRSIRMPTCSDLPVGVQQRVEIIKLLYREADILILDEPTAVLTPQEADELFEIMRIAGGEGQVDHLHHPQAARGAGIRRPHHRHPARARWWAAPRPQKPTSASWPR